MDDAVLLEGRLEPGEPFDGRPTADAFVGHHRLAVGEHRHDLSLERAIVLRRGRQFVGAHRVFVEAGPRKAPLLCDELRGNALIEREVPIAGKDIRAVRHTSGPRRPERHPAHHLDTACTAKSSACWLDPQARLMVVPGMCSGQPAAKTEYRPMLLDWSPTCETQP